MLPQVLFVSVVCFLAIRFWHLLCTAFDLLEKLSHYSATHLHRACEEIKALKLKDGVRAQEIDRLTDDVERLKDEVEKVKGKRHVKVNY